jgi:CRP-like cAMP-binding protein
MPGGLLRVPIAVLRREFEASAHIRDLILSYTEALRDQIQQTVACNAMHTIQQRVCRLLLMMYDRADGEPLAYTHEFLAGMLGANRKSMTLVAQALERKGFIAYRRGKIQVLDASGLEKASCECYGVIKRRLEVVFAPPLHVDEAKAR